MGGANLRGLIAAPLVDIANVPKTAGVYVFFDDAGAIGVGRTNDLSRRIPEHFRLFPSNATLAFRIAKQKFLTLRPELRSLNRGTLANRPDFRPYFIDEIEMLRKSKIRYFEVSDNVEQAKLEMDAARHYGLPLDEFGNH